MTFTSVRQPRWSRRLLALCLLFVLGANVLQPAQPTAAAPRPVRRVASAPNTGHSLRIASYDVANYGLFWTWYFGSIPVWIPLNGHLARLDNMKRDAEIAETIKRNDDDVVVITGAYDDFGRSALFQFLHDEGDYKYVVDLVDGSVKLNNVRLVVEFLDLLCTAADFAEFPCPSKLSTLGGSPKPNHSGMMVFSKYPFAPFNRPLVDNAAATVPTHPLNAPARAHLFQNVSTTPFNNGGPTIGLQAQPGFWDSFQAKAVGMVRVENPNTSEIANVVFTNMQSGDSAEDQSNRAGQLDEIKTFVRSNLTSGELYDEHLYMLGNLSLDGGSAEWKSNFADTNNPSAGFFACDAGAGDCGLNPFVENSSGTFLEDVWGKRMPAQDPGVTDLTQGRRSTYLLQNHSSELKRCLQRIWTDPMVSSGIKPDSAPSIGLPLSEHAALRVDINAQAPHCSWYDDGTDTGPVVIDAKAGANHWAYVASNGATISYPGSVQWYRIDQPGSYGIRIGHNVGDIPVGYEVYAASDMSRPLAPYYGETSSCDSDPGRRTSHSCDGYKFSLSHGPYYVRVFAIDETTGKESRTATGDYNLDIIEFGGESPDNAILLDGGARTGYAWPSESGLANPEPVWFEFHSNQTDTGAFPNVDIQVENTNPLLAGEQGAISDVRIWGADACSNQSAPCTAPMVTATPPLHGKGGPDAPKPLSNGWVLRAPDLRGNNGAPKRYFATLSRTDTSGGIGGVDLKTPAGTFVTFHTDLTYFYANSIFRFRKWDNATLHFDADGSLAPSPAPAGAPVAAYAWKTVEPMKGVVIRYTSHLLPNLVHEGKNLPSSYGAYASCGRNCAVFEPINPLKPDDDGVADDANTLVPGWWQGYVWHDAGNPDEGDYWYQLRYIRRHDLVGFTPQP